MHHMVFLNPPKRSASGRFVKSPRRSAIRRKFPKVALSKMQARTGQYFSGRKTRPKSHRTFRFNVGNPTTKTTMARRTFRRRRSARVRRNPPKMTPAMRAKIGSRIRALHRAGKYRRSRRSTSASPVARRTRRRARSVVRSIRRSSFRRRSGTSRRRRSSSRSMFRSVGAVGGGMLGLKALLSRDNLMLAGGAIGGTFVANYSCAMIAPRLGNMGNNPFVQAAIKLGSVAIVAKVTTRWSRPVAQGILIGGMVVVLNDVIRRFAPQRIAAATQGQYLGGNPRGKGMAQYLGAQPQVGRDVRSLVGAVSPTARTFGNAGGIGGLYGGSSAFKNDAWSRK